MKIYVLVLVGAIAMQGCNSHTPSAAASGGSGAPAVSASEGSKEMTQQAAPGNAQGDSSADLGTAIQKNMAYADFRKVAIGKGWTPVKDPQCKVNVVGANYEELCSGDSEFALCKVCDEVPELSSCSADGNCLMQFSHPDSKQILQVYGYGEIKDWNVAGEDSGLRLTSWETADSATK